MRAEEHSPLHQGLEGGSEFPKGKTYFPLPASQPLALVSIEEFGWDGATTVGAQNRLPMSGPPLFSPALSQVWVGLRSWGPLWPSYIKEPIGNTGPLCGESLVFQSLSGLSVLPTADSASCLTFNLIGCYRITVNSSAESCWTTDEHSFHTHSFLHLVMHSLLH